MTEFLEMGGYGAFIWPSWGLAVLVLLGVTVSSLRHDRRIQKELEQFEQKPEQKKEQS
jgi:heme exporter protein D